MRVSEMNWMMVEEYMKRDDRALLPLGSTEQHAYLSLSVDSILAERLAVEAAEPFSIPVFPVLAYRITPYFARFQEPSRCASKRICRSCGTFST